MVRTNSKNSAAEMNLYLFTGEKREFGDLQVFWIKSFEMMVEILSRYEGERDYYDWFKTNCWVPEKEKFDKKMGFIKAFFKRDIKMIENVTATYQLRNLWNEQIFILENDKDYMFICWDTTA